MFPPSKLKAVWIWSFNIFSYLMCHMWARCGLALSTFCMLHIPVYETLDELHLREIYYNLRCFPSRFHPFPFVSFFVLHQSVHILFALSSCHAHFHFTLFPPSLPLLPFHRSAPTRPVRPPSGPRPLRPLRLLILFQGLKPSQTISADVFCTKGQRRWGGVCLGCVMRWNSGGLWVPFLQNANMLIQFSFPSFFLPFVWRFTSSLLLLCLAPTGGMRYSAGVRYSACCLCEPEDHLSPRLNASLSETMQRNTTRKQSSYTNCCSLITRKKNNTVKPCALLSLLSRILIYGCWVLPAWPCPPAAPNTKMSGSESRPGRYRATGHKKRQKWIAEWRARRVFSSPALNHQPPPTESPPSPLPTFAY